MQKGVVQAPVEVASVVQAPIHGLRLVARHLAKPRLQSQPQSLNLLAQALANLKVRTTLRLQRKLQLPKLEN